MMTQQPDASGHPAEMLRAAGAQALSRGGRTRARVTKL